MPASGGWEKSGFDTLHLEGDKMLSHKQLLELFYYNPETGIFISLKRRGRILAGRKYFPSRKGERFAIRIDNIDYRVHRLAFLYMTGRLPIDEVDHINGDPSDNRWCNLREATRQKQMANTRKPSTNKSGYKGVSWHKGGQKWQVHIKHQGINHYLGLYKDLEEAASVYRTRAIDFNGEFARRE